MGSTMARVLIVQAHAQGPPGLLAAVRAAFPTAQVAHVQCAADALRLIGGQAFELALIDPDQLEDGGLTLLRVMQAQRPGPVAVVMTSEADDGRLFPALRAGAFGYLLNDQPQAELVVALKRIARGEPALSPVFSRRVLRFFVDGDAYVPPAQAANTGDVPLNPRETEILQRVAKGFTLPEIAAQLGLSRHTVADYVKQIYRKLSVSSRAEAALEAARRGLV